VRGPPEAHAFIELNRHLLRRWCHEATVRRWHGLDVRAVDGSTVRSMARPCACPTRPTLLPRSARWSRLTAHRRLWRGSPRSAIRSTASFSTPSLPRTSATNAIFWSSTSALHLGALEAGNLLLLDRGYPAFWLFAALHRGKLDWCARVVLDSWSVVRHFLATGQDDAVVTLPAHAEAQAECRARGLPMTPIRVRLIRVVLPTGEVEVLMTSLLDPEIYPAQEFAELYHLRWTQEERYKCFKSRVEVENWSGKSALSMRQDFHAKVLTLNLTAVRASTAQDIVEDRHRDDRHPKQVNMTHALCAMKDAVVRLLTRANPVALRRRLIEIFADTVEPVRPGRSHPRRKGPRLHGYSTATPRLTSHVPDRRALAMSHRL
jgi:hypothetical protein